MKNETARREIESLDYYLQNHTNDYSEESHTAMMMAIDALSNSEKPDKWIPVSEKLPEKNVEVLATTEWGAVTIAEMYSANDWFIHEGTTNAEADEIVAWMPLPKPFKPQESEG
jgi:hypothetical protein